MRLLLISIACALTGCATVPPPASEASPAPEYKLFQPKIPDGTPTATLLLIRDNGLAGAAVDIHVSVDGARVASLSPGEKAALRIEAGDRVLSAVQTDPFGAMKPIIIEASLKPDRTYLYRVGFDGGNGPFVPPRMSFHRDVAAQ